MQPWGFLFLRGAQGSFMLVEKTRAGEEVLRAIQPPNPHYQTLERQQRAREAKMARGAFRVVS